MTPQGELPAQPLLNRIGVDHKNLPRWNRLDLGTKQRIGRAIGDARVYSTFLLYDADLIAVELLGTHPARIWGEDFWTADGPLPELTLDELEEMGAA